MAGIDRHTGKLIDNYSSALQSVEVIFTTRLNSRVMRRQFGGGIPEILGRQISLQLFGMFQVLLVAAIDVWEPRFRVRKLTFNGSADEVRLGKVNFTIEVDWRPRGHQGDETVVSVRSFNLGINRGTVTVT